MRFPLFKRNTFVGFTKAKASHTALITDWYNYKSIFLKSEEEFARLTET